ncbi:ATP-dependent helicase [Candidatus Poriferisodalis sp.]|uniref:ATP-dependent helicase n=1 Tax=Candidatus Poriferisodalis sp. TaxID=3101277 RepID=UPI003C6FF449
MAPRLSGEALKAVKHRGTHLQIIASAGSGKTEVVSQRVADLLTDGVRPDGIVAFTFTERAAGELKERIELRVVDRMGPASIDRLNGLSVGTIHAYCFRLLQSHVPEYENFDVLDENQLTAFACREANRLGLRQFDPDNRLFRSVARFLENVEVVDNELLDVDTLPEDFRSVLTDYYVALDRYRLLTYGQQIRAAVEQLGRPEVAERVHDQLRHLIVDEYQDINPAQETLIERLTGPNTELCVVGDDDQAIYQWRGSDVKNIVTFTERYAPVTSFTITTNRRSRPEIVKTANRFAKSIPDRLAKAMRSHRPSAGSAPRVVVWDAEDEQAEASWIAEKVLELRDAGVPYKDIGVLVRTRAAYARLLEELNASEVPVQPGGRTGLFDQPEAEVLGKTYCWLTDVDWREPYKTGGAVELKSLFAEYESVFGLRASADANRLKRHLQRWQTNSRDEGRTADLVGDFYGLLDLLKVRDWDLNDPIRLSALGTLARFTSLLAEYESVRRRSRQDADNDGEQVGGEWGGEWYYRNLAIHIVNYAQGRYEGFDGEPDLAVDAVDITTIHKAKGLEWPAVFVPSMTKNRFPPSRMGRERDWIVPRELFDAARYEGSDADERRLFYVAISRAREWLSISRHARVTKQSAQPSPYWTELGAHHIDPSDIDLPNVESHSTIDQDPLAITFSDLASFLDCGMAYRLRTLVGFQPRLAPELGYGRAVHHLLRRVAEQTQTVGAVPTESEVEQMLDNHFFLPAANKAAHRTMKDAAKRLIQDYINNHEDDLHRVWETERPFELHLDAVTVSGRADVILDEDNGVPSALAIVDYKTSTDGSLAPYELQLQVYADAGRREGLDVRGAYLHDLNGTRKRIEIDVVTIASAERKVEEAAHKIRNREFEPLPGTQCRTCEVRTICNAKPT